MGPCAVIKVRDWQSEPLTLKHSFIQDKQIDPSLIP